MGIESFEQVCLVNGLIRALKVKAECVLQRLAEGLS